MKTTGLGDRFEVAGGHEALRLQEVSVDPVSLADWILTAPTTDIVGRLCTDQYLCRKSDVYFPREFTKYLGIVERLNVKDRTLLFVDATHKAFSEDRVYDGVLQLQYVYGECMFGINPDQEVERGVESVSEKWTGDLRGYVRRSYIQGIDYMSDSRSTQLLGLTQRGEAELSELLSRRGRLSRDDRARKQRRSLIAKKREAKRRLNRSLHDAG